MQETGLIDSSSENIWLSEGLFGQFFPEHRVLHSWSLSELLSWRSVTAVASDLIFVEADGKQQFLVGRDSLMVIDSGMISGGFSWPFCPMVLGQVRTSLIGHSMWYYWTIEDRNCMEQTEVGLPWWLRGWNVCLQCRRPGFDPWRRKDPLEKEMATHSSILA